MMKKAQVKDEKKDEIKPYEIGDLVLTPISDRLGVIKKIEEMEFNYEHRSYLGMPRTFKTYTVHIRLPHRIADCFKEVIVLCGENELERKNT